MEKGGWMWLHFSDIFSIDSPQISAVRDSVLDSPEIHIGQNRLPTSLKSHAANTVHTLGSFQVPTRPEITSFVWNALTKLHTPVSKVVHSNNVVFESLL